VVQPLQDLLDRLAEPIGDAGLLPAKPGRVENPSPRLRHAMAIVDRQAGTRAHQVELRLFGPPRVVLDGKDVPWPGGMRRKSIELFWYAAVHPEGFTRDQAHVDLFAEHDEARGRRLASVAIADLRRALAEILRVPGNRVLAGDARHAFVLRLDEVAACVRMDTRDLADLADELRASRRRPPPTTVPEYFRGELVAGLTAEWIEPIRRYWSAVYLRTLATLAARFAKRGELQQAIRCHELALAVDPTLESSHATLIRLFHAAGDHQALEAQMWLYKHVASDELGLEPDGAVQELYDSLTASNP
jgi:two-component SAPR family response regulator